MKEEEEPLADAKQAVSREVAPDADPVRLKPAAEMSEREWQEASRDLGLLIAGMGEKAAYARRSGGELRLRLNYPYLGLNLISDLRTQDVLSLADRILEEAFRVRETDPQARREFIRLHADEFPLLARSPQEDGGVLLREAVDERWAREAREFAYTPKGAAVEILSPEAMQLVISHESFLSYTGGSRSISDLENQIIPGIENELLAIGAGAKIATIMSPLKRDATQILLREHLLEYALCERDGLSRASMGNNGPVREAAQALQESRASSRPLAEMAEEIVRGLKRLERRQAKIELEVKSEYLGFGLKVLAGSLTGTPVGQPMQWKPSPEQLLQGAPQLAEALDRVCSTPLHQARYAGAIQAFHAVAEALQRERRAAKKIYFDEKWFQGVYGRFLKASQEEMGKLSLPSEIQVRAEGDKLRIILPKVEKSGFRKSSSQVEVDMGVKPNGELEIVNAGSSGGVESATQALLQKGFLPLVIAGVRREEKDVSRLDKLSIADGRLYGHFSARETLTAGSPLIAKAIQEAGSAHRTMSNEQIFLGEDLRRAAIQEDAQSPESPIYPELDEQLQKITPSRIKDNPEAVRTDLDVIQKVVKAGLIEENNLWGVNKALQVSLQFMHKLAVIKVLSESPIYQQPSWDDRYSAEGHYRDPTALRATMHIIQGLDEYIASYQDREVSNIVRKAVAVSQSPSQEAAVLELARRVYDGEKLEISAELQGVVVVKLFDLEEQQELGVSILESPAQEDIESVPRWLEALTFDAMLKDPGGAADALAALEKHRGLWDLPTQELIDEAIKRAAAGYND